MSKIKLTGVAPPAAVPASSSARTYNGMDPEAILADMRRLGWTQAGVNKIYELRGLANPPQVGALEGTAWRRNKSGAFVGNNGKPIKGMDTKAAQILHDTVVNQSFDPYRERTGISNFAGGLMNAVGTYVGGPVWAAMTGIADAGNKALGNDDGTSYTDGQRSSADRVGAAVGAIAGSANGPGSYGANSGANASPNTGIDESGAGASSGSGNILGDIFGGGGGSMAGESGFDWGSLLNTALSAYGAYESGQGNKDARADLNAARLTTTLGGSSYSGPGGAGAILNPDGKGGASNLGDLEGMRNFLAQLGTQSSQSALTGGLPDNIRQALEGINSASGQPGMPDTNYLTNGVNNTWQQALTDMTGGIQGVQDKTLATLRAQAQPEETRAFDNLQNNLFSTGRLGSSGGALQTEAFAKGLGEADLSRQLQATNLGRGLLDDAFGRFNSTTGLASDLSQTRFGNSTLQNQTGYDRATANFGNQTTAAQLPTALQGNQLALALQALNGAGSLQDQGLQQFQAALAAASSGANARIGAGSVNAQLAGQRAAIPSSSDMWGQILTGIASRNGNQNGNGSVGTLLSGLFNGTKTTQPVGGSNWGTQAQNAGMG